MSDQQLSTLRPGEQEKVVSDLFIDAVLCPETRVPVGAAKSLPEDLSAITVPPQEAQSFLQPVPAVGMTSFNNHQSRTGRQQGIELQGTVVEEKGGEGGGEVDEDLDPRLQIRIIPQLVREVVTHTQARQILHIRLFADALPDFLEYCDDTTHEEWVMLLVLLFTFANRRGGLTPLQKGENQEISEVCFLMLYRLLAETHAQTVHVHVAMRDVLECLDLTEEALSGPLATLAYDSLLEPINHHQVETSHLPDPADVETSSDDDDEHGKTPEQQLSPPRGDGDAPPPSGAPLPFAPYFHSVDSLPPEQRGSLTEREFLALEQWYETEVHKSSEGKPLVSQAIKKTPPGGRFFPDPAMKAWVAENPTGEASLTDVLRFIFPDCPQRTILKRVAGQPLVEPSQQQQGTPTLHFVPPSPIATADRIARLVKAGKDSVSDREFISGLYEWFTALDFRQIGKLQRKQVEPFLTSATFIHGKKVPNSFDFLALVQFIIGDPSFVVNIPGQQALKKLVAEIEKEHEAKRKAQMNYVKADNDAFEQALIAAPSPDPAPTGGGGKKGAAAPPPPLSTPPTSPSKFSSPVLSTSPKLPIKTTEDGRLISALSPEQVVTLRQHNDDLLLQYLADQKKLRLQAKKEKKKTMASNERQLRIDEQEHDFETYDRTNVPVVYGPHFPQKEFIVAGIRITPATIQLDAFLELDGWKPLAMSLLRRMDWSGISPKFFVHDLKKFPIQDLLLERAISAANKVYRDCAFCTRREPAKGYWEGNHVLHVKTNIPTNSDTKYRIHLEGFNYGTTAPINSVCVGYAARMLEKIDNMEAYGWPDGWDAFTILHYGKGIQKIVQYITSDGYVALRCEAKSFQAVGFSISAWLVTPDFGNGMAFGAKVYHQDEDL